MLVGCGVGVLWAYGVHVCVRVCVCMCVCVWLCVLCVAAPVHMHTSIGYVDAPSLGLLVGEYV